MRVVRKKKTMIAALCLATAALAVFALRAPLATLYHTVSRTPDAQQLYRIDGVLFDTLSPLNEKSVRRFGEKITALRRDLFAENERVFYAVVPDKGYFVREAGYPTLDYDRMEVLLRETVQDIPAIDLDGALSLDCYYKTDTHWRQERLFPVLKVLGDALCFSVDEAEFTAHCTDDFVGTLGRRYEKLPQGEQFCYLTSEASEHARVDNLQKPDRVKVYDAAQLDSKNPYDVFLSGVSPVITIHNDRAQSERALIVFRDSFASSLAPLLIGEYRTITLIDLRFISSAVLRDYVAFSPAQDVLFLYSTWTVNQSAMLR